jgi:hypothetical protein
MLGMIFKALMIPGLAPKEVDTKPDKTVLLLGGGGC